MAALYGNNIFRRFPAGRMNQAVVCCLLIIFLCATLHVMTAHAQNMALPVEDSQEESENKGEQKLGGRWLPIPLFLTEPAFGYGLGVALAYFHSGKNESETLGEPSLHTITSVSSGRSGQKPPPTITGVAAGYTDNETWAAAVAHSTSWRKDTIRYAGGLAYADVNSTYYIHNQPFDFNLKGVLLYQDLKFRLGSSRFFLGGKLILMDTESHFNTWTGKEIEIGTGDLVSRNIGIAAAATYDGRDNVFTPNSGQLLQLDIWRYSEGLGGDYNYWLGKFKALSFHPLLPDFVLGLRLEASALDGTAPFYAYPWVSLRGIPALRYQGEGVAVVEAEARWNILPRWAIIAFLGTGAADYGRESSSSSIDDKIYAGGVGARYFMMRDLGLWLGVDLAHGPEDWYSYITVGHAW